MTGRRNTDNKQIVTRYYKIMLPKRDLKADILIESMKFEGTLAHEVVVYLLDLRKTLSQDPLKHLPSNY